MNNELKQQVVLTVLNTMMKSDFFSICAVRDAANLLGIPRSESDAWRALEALHCVHWNQMLPEVRKLVPVLIQEVLSEGGNHTFYTAEPAAPMKMQVLDALQVPEIPVAEPKKGWRRLLGG